MGDWRRQFSRPVLWLLGGLLAGVIGAGAAVLAVETVAKIPGIDELPPCQPDFAGDCVTVRDAVVAGDGYHRHSARGGGWFVDVKRWDIRLDAPGPDGEHHVRVELRDQAERQRLIRGTRISITYIAKDAAWVEFSDGTTLTTEDHPLFTAPMWSALALFAGGTGTSLVHTALRASRRRGSWFGRADLHLEPNVGLFIAVAGILAFCLSFLLPRPAPLAIFAALLLLFAAIRLLPWRRILRRRRPQGGQGPQPGRHAATKRRGRRQPRTSGLVRPG